MARRGGIWLIGALVLAAALIWWLQGEGPSGPPSQKHPGSRSRPGDGSTPRLLGAGAEQPHTPGSAEGVEIERETAVERKRAEVGGRVVDERGDPVPGARVFLVPKVPPPPPAGLQGGVPPDPPNATSGDDGRWRLGAQDLSGHWIGAVALGYLPAHRDGDALGSPEEIELMLERGPEVLVRVQGPDGGPLERDTKITLVTLGDGYGWPRPGQPWIFQQDVDIPAGSQQARLRSSTRGPVAVSADYPHYYWIVEPEMVAVEPPGDEVVFTISRSCVLVFRVTDAGTGQPLPRGFTYTLLHDGKPLTGGATIRPGGHMRVQVGIRPGAYTLRVAATGYVPRTSGLVSLREPGEEATVEVALARDETRGNLRVSIPLLAKLPRRVGPGGEDMARAPFFRWRRPLAMAPEFERAFATPGKWGRLDCESRRESDTDYLFEGVPAGEVGLLVGEAESGCVAFVPSVLLRAGRTETVGVAPKPGIRVKLSAVLPPKGGCRSFRVVHPIHGVLPTWSIRVYAFNEFEAGTVPPRDLTIGPYPGPSIRIELTDAEGTVTSHEFDVPGR